MVGISSHYAQRNRAIGNRVDDLWIGINERFKPLACRKGRVVEIKKDGLGYLPGMLPRSREIDLIQPLDAWAQARYLLFTVNGLHGLLSHERGYPASKFEITPRSFAKPQFYRHALSVQLALDVPGFTGFGQ